ncbi:DUF4097 family beta strand repeat-containing protein [Aminipila terrae]|uniref:DUF4097 family beta strand repeat protein n=1 Tax=Aminipila terrae TaxID=2697030 RepID=A0A6P1MJ47_9FIRM|nr:DUF4097 family beta strand repeat-containing protein [Aminipila terrae]QHI72644.1 DUF4097 family beta strand repeat protein [Aminipila terrae]
MNKKLKIYIIVCICLIVSGLCFAGIGLMLGSDGNIELNHFSWDLGDNSSGLHIGTSDQESTVTLSGQRVTESTEVKQPVNVIKTKVTLGNIRMIESNDFKVVYTYDKKFGKPEIKVSNGTLSIVDKLSKKDINLGIKKENSLKNNDGIEYKIYYPKGTKVKLIDMENNLGNVDISGIETEALNIRLDLGDVELTGVKGGTVSLDTNLGDVSIKNIQTQGLSVDTQMGDIDIDGTLKGKNTIVSDMGDIDVQTTLNKEEYSLKLNTDMGDITAGKDSTEGTYEVHNNSDNLIDAQASTGDIRVEFH